VLGGAGGSRGPHVLGPLVRPLHLLALPSGSALRRGRSLPSPRAVATSLVATAQQSESPTPWTIPQLGRRHQQRRHLIAVLNLSAAPHPPACLNLSSLAIVALCCRRRPASGLRAHRLSLRQSRPSPRKGSSERPSVEQRRELAIGLARGLRPRSLHCVAVTRPLPSQ